MVVADDELAVRQGVAAMLAEEDDFVVVAHAGDGRAALALAETHGADLVLVDVRMPDGGPDLVRALRALSHRPVVVGLSANADSATWLRMLVAGATGYLLKGNVGPDGAELLRRCVRGELVVAVPGATDALRRHLESAG